MKYLRSNPELSQAEQDEQADVDTTVEAANVSLQKRAQRQATTKAMTKMAAKTGLKTAVKVAGMSVGVGEILGAAEAAPVVYREARATGRRAKKSAKKAFEAAKKGQYVQAGKEAAKGAFGYQVDKAVIGAKAVTAFVSSRELADRIPSRKEVENPRGKKNMARYAQSNPGLSAQRALYPAGQTQDFDNLLSLLIQLRTTYLYMHWNAKTYSEHLQYERLYQTLDEDIDTLAELAVKEVGHVRQVATVVPLTHDEIKEVEVAAQEQAAAIIEKTKLKQVNFMALENFLLNLIQNRQRVLYLLDLR